MKITSTCMLCLQENNFPSLSMSFLPIPDDGIVSLRCEAGHVTQTVIQQERFEILSELAITAIVDGYYREGVASFAASLERLYEFYLRTVWHQSGLSESAVKSGWNQIRNSSERQLGAFLVTFMVSDKVSPPFLSDEQVAFRNSVVHKGKFPSKDEAIAFGQSVANIAIPILTRLGSDEYYKHANLLVMKRLESAYDSARSAGIHPVTHTFATPFSLKRQQLPLDVASAINEHSRRPKLR